MHWTSIVGKPLPQSLFLFCPRCQFAVDGSRPAFAANKLDHKTWCKRCHRSFAVQDWQCACHMPRHACPLHSNEPSRLRKSKEGKHSKRPHTVPKRTLAEACTEEGARKLDEAGRIPLPTQTEDIDLGPNKPMRRILPKLRHKFRRILQSDPGILAKPREGEAIREVDLGGRRPDVEPHGQVGAEEASTANTSMQQEWSRGGRPTRDAARCDHPKTADQKEQAGKAQQGASTAPAATQGPD